MQSSLVAGKAPKRMLGYESVTTGIASPEIADDVVGHESRSLRSYHGTGANCASRQIASARIGIGRHGRQHFSNCWHRGLLCDLDLSLKYTPICLTLSQQNCVRFTLFSRFSIVQCSEFMTPAFPACTSRQAAPNGEEPLISRTLLHRSWSWTRRQPRVQCTVLAGAAFSTASSMQ